MDDEERQHQRRWDLDRFGPGVQRDLPDNVDRIFESAWVALERERLTALGALPTARDVAAEAGERLAKAKREAEDADASVGSITEKLHRLIEQQEGMAN